MTQPFRDSGFACPTCRSNLRVYSSAGRLICNECESMMLTNDDFVASLTDRLGEAPVLADDDASDKRCPRCQMPFVRAHVVLGKHELKTPVLHCEKDGVWFAGGDLEEVLTQVNRTVPSYVGGAISNAAGPGLAVGLEGGNIANAAVANAFANRDQFVMWYWRRPKPRTPPAPYKSALSGSSTSSSESPTTTPAAPAPACPDCHGPLFLHGNLWGCQGGHGVFVENDALVSLASDMLGADWHAPKPKGSPGTRACPGCATPMIVEELEGVTVDRCATHGTWFDPQELERALEHVAIPDAVEPTKKGFRHWLRHLFE